MRASRSRGSTAGSGAATAATARRGRAATANFIVNEKLKVVVRFRVRKSDDWSDVVMIKGICEMSSLLYTSRLDVARFGGSVRRLSTARSQHSAQVIGRCGLPRDPSPLGSRTGRPEKKWARNSDFVGLECCIRGHKCHAKQLLSVSERHHHRRFKLAAHRVHTVLVPQHAAEL